MSGSFLAAFEVVGVPAPQGSKTRMPNGAMLDGKSATARANHRAWRNAVAHAARDAAEAEPFDGPLMVTITFRLPMPRSRPKRDHFAGECPAIRKPDIDKLIRSTLDGLTDGGIITDDARIFDLHAIKREVVGWTGAEILIRKPVPS